MRYTLALLALMLCSACSTTHLAWKPAADKDDATMLLESRACLVSVADVPPGKFGDRREKAYLNCMLGQGHELVELPN